MPSVTPSGPLSVAVDALRTLLANCAQFQSWTGTADAAAALGRIFTGELGWPIVQVAIAGGVATVTTREPHSVQVGDVVTIEGASLGDQSGADLAGQATVTAVTAASVSFATAAGAGGPYTPDGALLLPCARPFAVVVESDADLTAEVVGTGGASVYSGQLEILLEGVTSQAYWNDPVNALYEARNSHGAILQDLAATQGTGDLMCLNSVASERGPRFVSLPEQDDNAVRFERWQSLLKATWGITG